MTISAIVLGITGVFGGGQGTGGPSSKDKRTLKKKGYSGWQMHLKGSKERLLKDCLPSWEALLVSF